MNHHHTYYSQSAGDKFGCSKKETKQVGVEETIFNNPGWNLNWHRFSFRYPLGTPQISTKFNFVGVSASGKLERGISKGDLLMKMNFQR